MINEQGEFKVPITITLTQEQALDVINQLTGSLSSANGHGGGHANGHGEALSNGSMRAEVFQEVASYPKHKMFTNGELQHKFNFKGMTVSNALMTMQKQGKVKMIKRGTWQVV